MLSNISLTVFGILVSKKNLIFMFHFIKLKYMYVLFKCLWLIFMKDI